MHSGMLTRRAWLFGTAGLASGALLNAVSSVALHIRKEEDFIRVAAPYLHFLSGRPLERLKSGAAVLYTMQLAISRDNFTTLERRAFERFVVSFDIWEEKFSIVGIGMQKGTASHLDSIAAEEWCVKHLGLTTRGLNAQTPYWVRLELRAEEPKDAVTLLTQPPIALTKLVELFARPPKHEADRWAAEQGPFRLMDLKL